MVALGSCDLALRTLVLGSHIDTIIPHTGNDIFSLIDFCSCIREGSRPRSLGARFRLSACSASDHHPHAEIDAQKLSRLLRPISYLPIYSLLGTITEMYFLKA